MLKRLGTLQTAVLALFLLSGSLAHAAHPSTFSIVAYDPQTGALGVAVQSKFPAVGALVPWAKAGVGAIATQAAANLEYGEKGLQLLASGLSAEEVMKRLTEDDPGREGRQIGVVDARGGSAAFTGKETFNWAGQRVRRNYTCQGNVLAGAAVVEEMGRAFEETRAPFAERLVAALEAGQRAGGDRRGRESAALLVVRKGGGYGGVGDRWIDLRVDDHTDPITELKRLLQVHTLYFGLTAKTIKLTPPLIAEIQTILKGTGFYDGPASGVYDAATRKALEDFQGWENLEMRFRKDDQIDEVVLDYMRRNYGKNPRRLKQ